MKKTILFLLLLLSANLRAAPQEEKLTVILDWLPNTTHAPLIIAQQEGFFKEQGLDVELIHPKQQSESAKVVAQGKADIGLTFEPSFIEQVDHHLPIIRIGTLIDKPLNCIVTLKHNHINSIADFKGKKIGSANNNLSNILLTTMLEKQGLSNKDITLMNMRQNSLAQALISHKVDAISGDMRHVDVPLLETRGRKLTVFFPEEHGVPNYSALVFIANITRVRDPRFPRFLASIKKAVRYLDDHPEKAWLQFAKQYPHLNNALNREYWFATMPYFAEDPASFNSSEWRHFANFMQKNQLISKPQPISRYAINLG
jgi:putative hydroxymethylpyrimidine transport system substrate-binding protein